MNNIALARNIVSALEALPANRRRVRALETVVAAINDRALLDEIAFELPRENVATRHHNDMLAVISARDEVLLMEARRSRLAVAA